jgi:hypothetical protein
LDTSVRNFTFCKYLFFKLRGKVRQVLVTSLVGSGATEWLVVKGLSRYLGDRWLAKYKSGLDKEFEEYIERRWSRSAND